MRSLLLRVYNQGEYGQDQGVRSMSAQECRDATVARLRKIGVESTGQQDEQRLSSRQEELLLRDFSVDEIASRLCAGSARDGRKAALLQPRMMEKTATTATGVKGKGSAGAAPGQKKLLKEMKAGGAVDHQQRVTAVDFQRAFWGLRHQQLLYRTCPSAQQNVLPQTALVDFWSKQNREVARENLKLLKVIDENAKKSTPTPAGKGKAQGVESVRENEPFSFLQEAHFSSKNSGDDMSRAQRILERALAGAEGVQEDEKISTSTSTSSIDQADNTRTFDSAESSMSEFSEREQQPPTSFANMVALGKQVLHKEDLIHKKKLREFFRKQELGNEMKELAKTYHARAEEEPGERASADVAQKHLADGEMLNHAWWSESVDEFDKFAKQFDDRTNARIGTGESASDDEDSLPGVPRNGIDSGEDEVAQTHSGMEAQGRDPVAPAVKRKKPLSLEEFAKRLSQSVLATPDNLAQPPTAASEGEKAKPTAVPGDDAKAAARKQKTSPRERKSPSNVTPTDRTIQDAPHFADVLSKRAEQGKALVAQAVRRSKSAIASAEAPMLEKSEKVIEEAKRRDSQRQTTEQEEQRLRDTALKIATLADRPTALTEDEFAELPLDLQRQRVEAEEKRQEETDDEDPACLADTSLLATRTELLLANKGLRAKLDRLTERIKDGKGS
ncbi:unnamed protein product [Amoebophrya sp. A120]|nr:unnamed protein product [Amoebophrya sp. A120]|eukprot:GSA120T00004778001.1